MTLDQLARLVLAGDVGGPGILGHLLQAQGDAAAILVHRKHAAFELLALLDHLVGMADLPRPRHVADVQQAVDALLDLDEGAVVGEVADRALDDAARRVASATRSQGFSWVCFMPSEISCFSLLMPSTTTSISSSLCTNSLGWLIRRVHDISLICTRPSMPSSSLTKAP